MAPKILASLCIFSVTLGSGDVGGLGEGVSLVGFASVDVGGLDEAILLVSWL